MKDHGYSYGLAKFILDFQNEKRQNSQLLDMAMWLSWLERGTHNAEVGGSSPPIATIPDTS